MKTCWYDNHLENLLPWSQVLVCMGSPLSTKSTQTQEFIKKSQQKKVFGLNENNTRSLCQQMPFPALWLWTGKSLIISQCDLGLIIENHYSVMPKISPRGKKKSPSLSLFVKTLSMNEVWKKKKQGWYLPFLAWKFLYLKWHWKAFCCESIKEKFLFNSHGGEGEDKDRNLELSSIFPCPHLDLNLLEKERAQFGETTHLEYQLSFKNMSQSS